MSRIQRNSFARIRKRREKREARASVRPQKTGQLTKISNRDEARLLRRYGGDHGVILNLASGKKGRGAHLSIHGLGTGPDAMLALNQRAHQRGQNTSTFLYKDMRGADHRMNSKALAEDLKTWAAQHPGEKLTIDTHSQGGRITLSAMQLLVERGEMPKNPIELNMVSPPLAGFKLANAVLPLPAPVARTIPGGAPVRDMASGSRATREVQGVKLPTNVSANIFYGSADRLVDYTKPGHSRVAKNLGAEIHYLPGRTHFDAVEGVARGEGSTGPVDYSPKNRLLGTLLK